MEIRGPVLLPALREEIELRTLDGLTLVGELALPESRPPVATLVTLHPLPTAGGFMDSHILRKAAGRLPALADLAVLRFNTRGTTSPRGTSDGAFDGGRAEAFDVAAAMDFVHTRGLPRPWLVGWSFGTELALKYGRDHAICAKALWLWMLSWLRAWTRNQTIRSSFCRRIATSRTISSTNAGLSYACMVTCRSSSRFSSGYRGADAEVSATATSSSIQTSSGVEPWLGRLLISTVTCPRWLCGSVLIVISPRCVLRISMNLLMCVPLKSWGRLTDIESRAVVDC